MSEQSYWSVEDVAKRFGITATTVYRLAQRGVLPGFKIGGQWRFSPEMLESWVVDQITIEQLRTDEDTPPKKRRPAGEP